MDIVLNMVCSGGKFKMSKYYFAPMEGITGYIHRNAYEAVFPGIDKYFTAFIAPNQNGKLSAKEKNDILPEHNDGMYVVPQMLTNRAEDFLLTANKLMEYGYREVNLNLGCPSRTVVSKYRGAGFLAKPEELDRFLDKIFSECKAEISIKTRTGIERAEEFYRLIEIYNRYPVKELIIHPRTQQDYYKNKPDWDIFKEAVSLSGHPICYNGDIFSVQDSINLQDRFPELDKLMLGRGLLYNPGLADMLKGKPAPSKEKIRKFHDMVYEGYRQVLCGDKVVLFKMKELWTYMSYLFTDNKKYAKKIKKAEKLPAYEAAVSSLFSEQEIDL